MEKYSTWRIISSYWRGRKRVSAYLSVIIILAMTIALVGMDVLFNYWYNFFYNALQAYNKTAAVRLVLVFFMLAALNIVLSVYRYYISQLFGLRWRKYVTDEFLKKWLHHRGYYYLENFDQKTDNPDQRIQEDIGALVTSSIELTVGLVSAVTTFFAFISILWTLSGVLTVPLGSWGKLAIPGYLVWVSLIYALIGTLCTFKIGKPLIMLNFEQQRREATFRYAAIDLRSHAEHVALYRGEKHQRSILDKVFGKVLDNYYLIILRQKLLLWFTAGYNQTSVLLPLLVALPNYFNKVFLLGGLMQTLQAFGSVQSSLSFIVNSYTSIASWLAVNKRLTTFMNHLEEAQLNAKEANKLQFSTSKENSIVVKDVSIFTPQKETLLKNINTSFVHGSNYLIKGDSGLGKSTFIRAIAGIWPYAEGAIVKPDKMKTLYLPQKPYMPIGTLAEALLFPDKEKSHAVDKLKKVLADCNLEHLIPRLHDSAAWSDQLSPGEQQRIAFARVLLHRPDWVFLDESTSMLDLANEKHLYELLKKRLPHATLISIGHRPTLSAFHEHTVNMMKFAPSP